MALRRAVFQPLALVVMVAGIGGVATAAIPVTAPFTLEAPESVLFESIRLYDERHVLQSFAFDDAGGQVYFLQVEGANAAGTFAEHTARGDLILTRVRLRDGAIDGHMVLRGFGHGVAMGVERDGAAVCLWTEIDAEPNPKGSGRGARLGRFAFVDALTLDASSSAIRKFAPIAGARVCTPSIDATHGRIAMRYVSAAGEWRVALFNLSQLKAGDAAPLSDIRLPFAFGTVQGWCTYGSQLYVYAGNAYGADNPAPGNATLWAIDWNTEVVIEKHRTKLFAPLRYREPEGLAIQLVNGTPRLCFGFASWGAGLSRCRAASIGYIDRRRARDADN